MCVINLETLSKRFLLQNFSTNFHLLRKLTDQPVTLNFQKKSLFISKTIHINVSNFNVGVEATCLLNMRPQFQ